eukprot:CAMPEP_0197900874 /NCGR_PEP_ID=MMETSP1439-20131203/50167_1 /TAXON_ID=66791 /ORGANISM="Gonyaulax spinifera, Strain CCMP409" /LENGTH=58 /DNA_ID=CAMNT_0043521813 /DNA_START=70 /DNA_END=243 /DNA_ORIENTATION=-
MGCIPPADGQIGREASNSSLLTPMHALASAQRSGGGCERCNGSGTGRCCGAAREGRQD